MTNVASVPPRARVLYVEDNATNVELVREVVDTLEGLDFVAAHTAEAGIALARHVRPDAILMDINLPGMSGLEALRALRAQPETEGVPVIAVTAAALPSDRRRGLDAGFLDYVTKPISIDALVTALSTALGRTAHA